MIGYARVSTIEQNPALQMDALQEAGAVCIFTDHASGATTAHLQLRAALDFLRATTELTLTQIAAQLGISRTTVVTHLAAQRGGHQPPAHGQHT